MSLADRERTRACVIHGTHVHVLADHGAWLLYRVGEPNGFLPEVH